jgi:hypothetical protein
VSGKLPYCLLLIYTLHLLVVCPYYQTECGGKGRMMTKEQINKMDGKGIQEKVQK